MVSVVRDVNLCDLGGEGREPRGLGGEGLNIWILGGEGREPLWFRW